MLSGLEARLPLGLEVLIGHASSALWVRCRRIHRRRTLRTSDAAKSQGCLGARRRNRHPSSHARKKSSHTMNEPEAMAGSTYQGALLTRELQERAASTCMLLDDAGG